MRRSLAGCCLLGAVAFAAFGCKCASTASVERARVAAVTASPAHSVATPLLEVESAYVALNRARRFSEARRLLMSLTPERAKLPSYRFVNAYLAVQTGDGEAALSLLEGLAAPELEPLATEVDSVRALAQLQTRDAATGALWLDAHGRHDAWLDAARSLNRLGMRDAALAAIERGLVQSNPKAPRADAKLADYRWLRLQLVQGGSEPRSLEDLKWLALEAPGYQPAREFVAQAIDSLQLLLDPAQQVRRLRGLADAGCVERLDLELERWKASNPRLGSAFSAYLRGRARHVSRRDQVEGAKWLVRAADLGVEDAARVRIDAARMYIREGMLEQATRQYERVSQTNRERRQEAEFYIARALSTLGQARRGVERFSRFLARFASGNLRRSAENERACAYLAIGERSRAYAELRRLAAPGDAREAKREANPALLQLAGLAALELGKQDVATEHWQAVVKAAPLTLAASFAAERLRRLGADVPTAHAHLEPGAELPLARAEPKPLEGELATLPRRVNQLLAFGLDELAAESLRAEQARAADKASNDVEASCNNWARVAFGKYGFVASRKIRGSFETSERVSDASRWRWECRFPRPYAAMVSEFEREFRLPEYLLFAVMRQESGFDPDIVSPANAVGLMQLLPQTAQRIAQEIRHDGELRLDEPRTSLRLGAAYLRRLLDCFEQNLVLAIAAYNAGPVAVSLWLKHAEHRSVELFAARIPYAETQKYVERVLANLLVYRHLNALERDLEGLALDLPQSIEDTNDMY